MKLINEARVESDGDRNLPQFCALSQYQRTMSAVPRRFVVVWLIVNPA